MKLFFLCFFPVCFGRLPLIFGTSKCPVIYFYKTPPFVKHGRLCHVGYEWKKLLKDKPDLQKYIEESGLANNQTVCTNEQTLIWTESNILFDDNSTETLTTQKEFSTEINDTFNKSSTANITIPADIYENFINSYPIEKWKSLGHFDDKFLETIHPYWLSYPLAPHKSYHILAGIYLILAVTGISGNFLVIFMILSFRSLRTPSNYLILNLATSDFMMLAKAPIFIYNSLYFGPALGSLGCQLYGFFGGLSGTASIMTLAAIALDRYYVIAHPLDPAHKTTSIRAIFWILLIWIYSIVFAGLPLTGVFNISKYVPEGYLISCSFDYLSETFPNRCFIFIFFLAAWFVPFSVITLSYIGICRAVLTVGMNRRGQEKEKRRREIKLALVVLLVISLWFVSWTPYSIVALLGIFGKKDLITPLASIVPALFCKSAACVNPFVYSLSHPRLKKEFFSFFCRKRYPSFTSRWSTWKTSVSYSFKASRRRENLHPDSIKRIDSYRKRNSETFELRDMPQELSSIA